MPYIVQRGKILQIEANHRGRYKKGWVIGAPVQIAGIDYAGLVVVGEIAKKGTRFYVHEVYLKERLQEGVFKPGASDAKSTGKSGRPPGALESILQKHYPFKPLEGDRGADILLSDAPALGKQTESPAFRKWFGVSKVVEWRPVRGSGVVFLGGVRGPARPDFVSCRPSQGRWNWRRHVNYPPVADARGSLTWRRAGATAWILFENEAYRLRPFCSLIAGCPAAVEKPRPTLFRRPNQR